MADNILYGAGIYGDGEYQPYYVAPDSVTDPDTIAGPTVSTTASVTPASVTDTDTIAGVSLSQNDNVLYGNADYNAGPYYGLGNPADQSSTPDSTTDGEQILPPTATFYASANPNYDYGAADYGAGVYFGNLDTPPPAEGTPVVDAEPMWPALPFHPVDAAFHILGIGPWRSGVKWMGAPNYGVYASSGGPALALPPATSKSFTLRVNEACEATCSMDLARNAAVIPEEMITDLWWRRRNTATGELEMIGRFNCTTSDVSTSDIGLSVSASFTDYRTLLGDRMLMKYKDTEHSENLWAKGTPIEDIMKFFVPADTPVDISVLDSHQLGNTTLPFEIALGATVAETFDNLLAISVNPWEWYIDVPNASGNPQPRLKFTVGTRGSNRGVMLLDLGGPGPVQSWTRTNYVDRYANRLYFIGADGGDVVADDDQITQFGVRDASDSDSSIKGTVKIVDGKRVPALLDSAARKALAKHADRRPTFSVVLTQGFWKGRSHIDAGDTVEIYFVLGRQALTGQYRVTELACAIDANNVETVTLTLGTPLTSGDPRSRRSAMARIVARLKNYERKDTSS